MADNATIKLGLNTSAVSTGLAAVKGQFAELKSFGAAQLAGTFGAAALAAGVGGLIEKGGQINDLAERFGLTAEALQRIGNAAAQNGSSLESAGAAMNKLALAQEKVREGDAAASGALQKLGIEAADFVNLSVEDAFFRIADATASAEDRQSAYASVVALMGKSSGELFTTLELGSAAIRDLGESVGVMSDETIAALDEMGDAIDQARGKFTAGAGSVFVSLVQLTEFAGRLASIPFGGSIDNERLAQLKELSRQYVELTEAAQRANAAGNERAETSALEARLRIEEQIAELKGERRAKPALDRDLEEGSDGKAREQQAAKLEALQERLAAAKAAEAADQLTGEARINALLAQRAELARAVAAASDPAQQIEAQLKVIEADKKIRDARERADADAERARETAARAAEQLAAKQQGLRDQQFSNFLAGEDDPGKINALEAKRAQLLAQARAESDQLKRADLGGEVLDVDAQLAALRRKPDAARESAPQRELVADRLTRIGLGGGALVRTRDPQEAAAQSLAKLEDRSRQQLEVLKRIEGKDPTWSP